MSSFSTAVALATLLAALLCPSSGAAQRGDPLQFHNERLWKSIRAPADGPPQPADPVIVAVLDAPVRADHEDLPDVVFIRPRLRDAAGHCAVDDCCPKIAAPAANWHATRVAGVIGATRGNGKGTAGIAPVRSIVSIVTHLAGRDGEINLASAIHCAIDYRDAAGRRVRVANISMGSVQRPATNAVKTALQRAAAADLLIVASAGNDGDNIDTMLRWPGSQNLPNIVTVETRRYDGRLARSASEGFGTVDLGAPAPMAYESDGHSLCAPSTPLRSSSSCSGDYGSFEQSSAATAVVSGAAALIWSDRRYAGCDAAQMRTLLRTSRSHCRRGYSRSEKGEAEVCMLDLAFLSEPGVVEGTCGR